jgi:hypothetical protein
MRRRGEPRVSIPKSRSVTNESGRLASDDVIVGMEEGSVIALEHAIPITLYCPQCPITR